MAQESIKDSGTRSLDKYNANNWESDYDSNISTSDTNDDDSDDE